LASRDPAERYTQDQVDLLRAIANMAAGAIVKVRLLEESNLRARQMEILNEVTRSLTSTLEFDILLERILRGAIEILACEAGCLLLVDEKSGAYNIELAVGSLAEELVGKLIPAGSGLVGKAITTGKPVVQNNAERKDWYATDEQTGCQTEDLLIVPLEVEGGVLGTLEVINKRDRSPMTIADQELLTAFAGQAMVALENARMYTTTDRALAARVQELSVLQRVDQELSANLELEQTMRITLGWAIRQTKADAGFAGLFASEGIQIVVSEGYLTELESFVDESMPVEIPVMKAAVNSRQIQRYQVMDSHLELAASPRLLSGANSQVAIPLTGRRGDVIGLLFLESRSADTFTDEKISFLSRMADHAAMAISNAQLYSAVQAANLSKSQFVSSAVHELKNPLTSIKGYSDLLMAGSVGPISEGQSNFLETIRANVDRMAMLVSDLQDISRIESGQLRLEFCTARIDEVIQEVAQSFSKQLEEKAQGLHLNIQADLPLVWGDRGRLVQILTNLVSNAHKYTSTNGEIHVKAECANKLVESAENLDAVHVSVKDSGIGISKDDQPYIFQQFFRSEEPEVRQQNGTGLGLSITKNLVEMQGGRIWFQSVENQGTTFHFTIPIAELEAEVMDQAWLDSSVQ
jgi:signal transduction histidine kinase